LSGLGSAAHAAEVTPRRDVRGAGASAADSADSSEQFVVHVRDAKTGQIDVFRGTSQIRVHDRDLARHLDRISRG
jgi:hypothetical protein